MPLNVYNVPPLKRSSESLAEDLAKEGMAANGGGNGEAGGSPRGGPGADFHAGGGSPTTVVSRQLGVHSATSSPVAHHRTSGKSNSGSSHSNSNSYSNSNSGNSSPSVGGSPVRSPRGAVIAASGSPSSARRKVLTASETVDIVAGLSEHQRLTRQRSSSEGSKDSPFHEYGAGSPGRRRHRGSKNQHVSGSRSHGSSSSSSSSSAGEIDHQGGDSRRRRSDGGSRRSRQRGKGERERPSLRSRRGSDSGGSMIFHGSSEDDFSGDRRSSLPFGTLDSPVNRRHGHRRHPNGSKDNSSRRRRRKDKAARETPAQVAASRAERHARKTILALPVREDAPPSSGESAFTTSSGDESPPLSARSNITNESVTSEISSASSGFGFDGEASRRRPVELANVDDESDSSSCYSSSETTGSEDLGSVASDPASNTRPPVVVLGRSVSFSESSNALVAVCAEMCSEEAKEFGFSLAQDVRAMRRAEDAKYRIAEHLVAVTQRQNLRKQRLDEVTSFLDQNPSVLETRDREEVLQNFAKAESRALRQKRTTTDINDFVQLNTLGQGGFGDVYLVQHRRTNLYYAMKQVPKGSRKRDVDLIMVERNVMAAATMSRWLVSLAFSFQDMHSFFLVMDYEPGGNLSNLLEKFESLNEKDSRFYFAEMILAVDALHKLGYVHRDLKPENFLVCRDGHLKLIDFGLAALADGPRGVASSADLMAVHAGAMQDSRDKKPTRSRALRAMRAVTRRRRKAPAMAAKRQSPKSTMEAKAAAQQAFSVVGSPEYMAPEVLRNVGYGTEADLWSLGVILFELMTGTTPFLADSAEEVFSGIRHSAYILSALEAEAKEVGMTNGAWNLSTGLMTVGNARLGSVHGARELLLDPWFSSYTAAAAPNDPVPPRNRVMQVSQSVEDYVLTLTPPLVPTLSDMSDVSYFDGDFVENRRVTKPQDVRRAETIYGFAFDQMIANPEASPVAPRTPRLNLAELDFGGEKVGLPMNDAEGDLPYSPRGAATSHSPTQSPVPSLNSTPTAVRRGRSSSLPPEPSPSKEKFVFAAEPASTKPEKLVIEAQKPGVHTAEEVMHRNIVFMMMDPNGQEPFFDDSSAMSKKVRKLFAQVSGGDNSKEATRCSRPFTREHTEAWFVSRLKYSSFAAMDLFDKLRSIGYIRECQEQLADPAVAEEQFQLYAGQHPNCINAIRPYTDPLRAALYCPSLFEQLETFIMHTRDIADPLFSGSKKKRRYPWVTSISAAAACVLKTVRPAPYLGKEIQDHASSGRKAFQRLCAETARVPVFERFEEMKSNEILAFMLNCHNALALYSIAVFGNRRVDSDRLWEWLLTHRTMAPNIDRIDEDEVTATASYALGSAFSVPSGVDIAQHAISFATGPVTYGQLRAVLLAGSCRRARQAVEKLDQSLPIFRSLPVIFRREPRLRFVLYMHASNDSAWLPQVFHGLTLDEELDEGVRYAIAGRVRVNAAKKKIYVPQVAMDVSQCFEDVPEFILWLTDYVSDPALKQDISDLMRKAAKKIRLTRFEPDSATMQRAQALFQNELPTGSSGRRASWAAPVVGRRRSLSNPPKPDEEKGERGNGNGNGNGGGGGASSGGGSLRRKSIAYVAKTLGGGKSGASPSFGRRRSGSLSAASDKGRPAIPEWLRDAENIKPRETASIAEDAAEGDGSSRRRRPPSPSSGRRTPDQGRRPSSAGTGRRMSLGDESSNRPRSRPASPKTKRRSPSPANRPSTAPEHAPRGTTGQTTEGTDRTRAREDKPKNSGVARVQKTPAPGSPKSPRPKQLSRGVSTGSISSRSSEGSSRSSRSLRRGESERIGFSSKDTDKQEKRRAVAKAKVARKTEQNNSLRNRRHTQLPQRRASHIFMQLSQYSDTIVSTWDALSEVGPAASRSFYEVLFSLDAESRGRFPEDKAGQHSHLIETLSFVTLLVSNFSAVAHRVAPVALLHQKAGIDKQHYVSFEKALLATFRKHLPEMWSDEAEEAWKQVFHQVIHVLLTTTDDDDKTPDPSPTPTRRSPVVKPLNLGGLAPLGGGRPDSTAPSASDEALEPTMTPRVGGLRVEDLCEDERVRELEQKLRDRSLKVLDVSKTDHFTPVEWKRVARVASTNFVLTRLIVDGEEHGPGLCDRKVCRPVHGPDSLLGHIVAQNQRLIVCSRGESSEIMFEARRLPLKASSPNANGRRIVRVLELPPSRSFYQTEVSWDRLGANVTRLVVSSNRFPSFAALIRTVSQRLPELEELIADGCSFPDLDLPSKYETIAALLPKLRLLSVKKLYLNRLPPWIESSRLEVRS